MNRIVREHYPAAKLPEDLRTDLPVEATVRIIIETGARTSNVGQESGALTEILERLKQMRLRGEIRPVSEEEAVARVRALRDEWD